MVKSYWDRATSGGQSDEDGLYMYKKNKTINGGTLREALLILVLSICTAFAVNVFRNDGLTLFDPPKPRGDAPDNLETPPSDGLSISIDEAIRHHEQQSAVFLDARASEDYARGHIPGAVSFPNRMFDEMIGPFLEGTPPEKTLITYCEGERCHLSSSLAEKLQLVGYENVYHMIDGLGQWKRRNLPLETGQ